MKRRTKKIIGAVVVVGAVAAGGAAYTAANSISPATVFEGYGTQTVTGATVTDTHYTLTADATAIDQVVLDFNPVLDPAYDTVEIGFAGSGDTPTVSTECTVAVGGATATCGPGLNVPNTNTDSGTLGIAVHHR